MAIFSFNLDIDGIMQNIEDQLSEMIQTELESEGNHMFQKLPSNSQQLLDDILAADNPVQMLQSRFEACSNHKDDELLRGIIGDLVEKGFIKVSWGDNVPYYVQIKNSARTYHEQLAEYEQEKQLAYGAIKVGNSLNSNVNKVFIVHGHDDSAKSEMARTLEKAGFEAIILHEQPDAGRTIIEKFEDYADVGFAVILYTKCDMGRSKEMPVGSEKYRARQNVVFEHGFFIGKLGRGHVCAFVKGDVETPSDLSGVLYVPMDSEGMWKIKLAKNMQAVGLSVDMNKFV